jgi:hypothetical protein
LLERIGVGGVFVELGFFVALAQVGDVHVAQYRQWHRQWPVRPTDGHQRGGMAPRYNVHTFLGVNTHV